MASLASHLLLALGSPERRPFGARSHDLADRLGFDIRHVRAALRGLADRGLITLAATDRARLAPMRRGPFIVLVQRGASLFPPVTAHHGAVAEDRFHLGVVEVYALDTEGAAHDLEATALDARPAPVVCVCRVLPPRSEAPTASTR